MKFIRSQWGTLLNPIEVSSIGIERKESTFFIIAREEGGYYRELASYDTLEKAEKAMDDLAKELGCATSLYGRG